MDQSSLHMQTRENFEFAHELPSSAQSASLLDRKVQQSAQSVRLSPTSAPIKRPLKVLHLASAGSATAAKHLGAKPTTLLQKVLPSTRASQQTQAAPSSKAPLKRPSTTGKIATVATSVTSAASKTALKATSPSLTTAKSTPATSSTSCATHCSKARGLEFSCGDPQASLRASLSPDSVSCEAIKPHAGGNGTTRFLGGMVVKGDDRETCEREILFSQVLRQLGVETPQVAFIDDPTRESLTRAVVEYKELLDSSEPGSKEIILMPQVKGATAEQCLTQADLLAHVRKAAPRLMQSIGHIAAIDLLLSNNDRLVRVSRQTRELETLNMLNLGNLMFTIEHGAIGIPVAIDNAGYNTFDDESVKSLDIDQFVYHLDHLELVAEHIMKGFARDMVWGTLSKNMHRANELYQQSLDFGFSGLEELATTLDKGSDIEPLYQKILTVLTQREEELEEPATTQEEQLLVIANFFGFDSLESCCEGLLKAQQERIELAPYFEGKFSVLTKPTRDGDPDLLPLQIELFIKYIGLDSEEEMKKALIEGLSQGKQAMMTTDMRAFFDRTRRERSDFLPHNLEQFDQVEKKLERLRTR